MRQCSARSSRAATPIASTFRRRPPRTQLEPASANKSYLFVLFASRLSARILKSDRKSLSDWFFVQISQSNVLHINRGLVNKRGPAQVRSDVAKVRSVDDRRAEHRELVAELRAARRRLAAFNELSLQLALEQDPHTQLEKVCHGAREL